MDSKLEIVDNDQLFSIGLDIFLYPVVTSVCCRKLTHMLNVDFRLQSLEWISVGWTSIS